MRTWFSAGLGGRANAIPIIPRMFMTMKNRDTERLHPMTYMPEGEVRILSAAYVNFKSQ